LDAEDREEREAEWKERKAKRDASALEEKSMGNWFDGIQAEADAEMIAVGFHKHKGQWRRKRK
jgi:hypothetical protein